LVEPAVIRSAVNAIALRGELEIGARKYASKEHLERSVEVVATATLVFVAIRSAAGVFVRRGRLGTSVTKSVRKAHMVSVALSGVDVLIMLTVIQ